MTKTAFLLSLIVTALASMPAHAQPVRVFVSGQGLDTNPCTVTQPCRTFQQAYNTAAANGEIDVLDPAGYGPLTITKGISIQAHGFGGITAASGNAITISVTTSDPVTLNGLLIDGAGSGQYGIDITSGASVEILNSVVRHFQYGIYDVTSTNGSNVLIEDTITSDNALAGIVVQATGTNTRATLNRITSNNNIFGVGTTTRTSVTNSVLSQNANSGLQTGGEPTYLAKTVISGNSTGVRVTGASVVNSYGDNYIADNATPVMGGLTPVTSLQSFSTNFPNIENPISLGGRMITANSPGVSWVWTPVIVASPGNAEALDYNQFANDALAVMTGTWRPDVGASVTVGPFAVGHNAPSEFEIHFRTDPATGAGYEITWGYYGHYYIIVQWFANGDFNYVLNDTDPSIPQLVPGDVLTATIIGSTITMYTNGVQVAQASDGLYTTGVPGFGFNGGGNASAEEYSISAFSTWEID
jgi:hypothetical protein